MKTKTLLLIVILLGINILSFAQIIHVPGEYSTVQEGINAATEGDTVLVDEGIYIENISFMGKVITVASHFIIDGDTNHINNTILDGSQPSNPDEASVVSFINGEDTTSIICGFTITGGTGMLEPTYNARIGGGIVCYHASAKILHNKITGNVVTSATDAWGGGVNCFALTGDYWAILEHNTITGNQSNAGNGWAEGGGVEFNTHARVYNNTITNNHCVSTSATGDADGGGLFHMSVVGIKSIIIKNNLISNNTLSANDIARGAGVSIWYSNCLVLNNTIYNNSSTGYITNGTGLFLFQPIKATIKENIIEGNSANTSNLFWGVGCMMNTATGPIKFENNKFLNNHGSYNVNSAVGGGLALIDLGDIPVVIEGNIFNGNQSRFGGGLYARSCYNLSVQNNYFTENESVDGGAVGAYIPGSAMNSRPVFINNTFKNNQASSRGGATHLNCISNIPIFFNCIFHNNTAPTGSEVSTVGNPQPVIISYSCIDLANISGSWTGTGNINEDPMIMPLSSLGHLSSSSPCINSGVSSLEVGSNTYFAPNTDIDWEPRPDMYGGIDMGSDEYWELPAVPIALDPIEQGNESFVAIWHASEWSTGYFLDVADDSNFTSFLSGYENLDVGNDTSYFVDNLQSGSYYYRVSAYSPIGASDHSNIIDVNLITGIDDPYTTNPTSNILIYPNPVISTAYIKGVPANHDHIRVSLINTIGTNLKYWQFDSEEDFILNLYDLSSGIYFIRVQTDNEICVVKVIKK